MQSLEQGKVGQKENRSQRKEAEQWTREAGMALAEEVSRKYKTQALIH